LIQALRKTKEAAPYIEQAAALSAHLEEATDIDAALKVEAIQDELVAAAGFSDKATKYFSPAELQEALGKVIAEIKANAGAGWKDEITYRYLLTKGDSLGGSMRNIVGSAAGIMFNESLIRALDAKGIKALVERSRTNQEKTQAIGWEHRHILFDMKSPIVGNSIDAILLDTTSFAGSPAKLLTHPERYLACGELKGGIDPAGADEHWKTARSALERIRTAFKDKPPQLFFVGVAIESAMAREIFGQLNDGRLTYAANLLSEQQLTGLSAWLVSI
jgi:type II restriction enzyme